MATNENKKQEMAEANPQEIADAARNISLNLLSTKSKEIYTTTYTKFVSWKTVKGIRSISEDVMLVYFDELSKSMKPFSLWSIFSTLKTILNHNDGIDIGTFSKLNSFLKKKSKGFASKKSKVFTPEKIDKLMKEAPDNEILLKKVVMAIGIGGACRRDEFHKMTINDVQDLGFIFKINIPKTKTDKPRSFVVSEQFYPTAKKYTNLRQADITLQNFFIKYQNGKCHRQLVEIHKFGCIPQEIATYLNLADVHLYTGHSFRRSSATILADSGATSMELKRHGGWTSSKVAENYVEDSLSNKRKIAERITNSIVPKASSSVKKQKNEISVENLPPSSKHSEKNDNIKLKTDSEHPITFNFTNCPNLQIHLTDPNTKT